MKPVSVKTIGKIKTNAKIHSMFRPLAVVTKVFPGRNKITRVAKMETSTGTYTYMPTDSAVSYLRNNLNPSINLKKTL